MKNIILIFIFMPLSVSGQMIELVKVGQGFAKPIDISSSNADGDSRLFITEKDGKIKILLEDGTIDNVPFLDIDSKVNSQANERGLLGLCFHPEYSNNGYFFVNYTNNNGNTTISRFKRSVSNANLADINSEKVILVVSQPFNNHNAGDLDFGPDGYLYIGLGDGGSGGDPGNRSQNPKDLLGKMLRLNVNTENAPYLIPDDNPYKNNPDTLPEIWALGLRNPWRFSFDFSTKELWIGDVGQDEWEEINVVPTNLSKVNYGWRCFEGFSTFNTSGCQNGAAYTKPVFVYKNTFNIGCSVTGGFVYRGSKYKSLQGKYIYTDFCTGKIWALYRTSPNLWINEELLDGENMDYVTFGENYKSELYLAGLSSGNIYRIEDKTSKTVELSAAHPFYILANPVSEILTIKSHTDFNIKNIKYKIINITGKLMISEIMPTINSTLEIDVSSLPAGFYVINVSDSIHQSIKFVKI